ncbi:S1 family peptidase [Microbacterium laevaniformans]|uniref:S1 family peptidase n=1 Tax=Microbacterium laevaniformans TaxID=36807 RepID=UPI003D99AAB5
MAAVQVLIDSAVVGQGTAIAPDVILTARHVVAEAHADSLIVIDSDGLSHRVHGVTSHVGIDIAALRVEPPLSGSANVGDAITASRWTTFASSPTSGPSLTGTVAVARRSFTAADGQVIEAAQLTVEQDLGDFHGYSGSGVFAADDGTLVAVLVEQHFRYSGAYEPEVAANVLFAVPAADAILALGIDVPVVRTIRRASLPSAMVYHEDYLASLRGYRSRLAEQNLRFIAPPVTTPWSPVNLWDQLKTESGAGAVLLTGHGGVGKTRTALEVGDIAGAEGWDVIHVRGGNAARVADAVGERLNGAPVAPLLLIVDYLNTTRDLDLLALTDLAVSDPSRPQLRLLATSRTGWESRNRTLPGLDRFQKVTLNRTTTDAEGVCTEIIEQIAPTAVRAFGARVVLEVTGSLRPILAVLLGQVVESEFLATGLLPDALISEDLARWLESRLLEDSLIPAPTSAGIDLPEHTLIAALILATAPVPGGDPVSLVASLLGEDRAELTAVMFEKLVKIGWLVATEEGSVPAHDVVVDKILESALFHTDSAIARATSLQAMLGVVATSPTAFTNVVAAMERVLDERTAQGIDVASLRLAANRWLTSNRETVISALCAEPLACARASVQLLESEVWGVARPDLWRDFVAPMLDSLSRTPLGGDAFLAAAKGLPRSTSPNVPALATAWLENVMIDEMVLNACLYRKDVDRHTSERLIKLGLRSLEGRHNHVTADFTLKRLLMRPELTGADLQKVMELAKDWLATHGEGAYSVHLLSALIDRQDLPVDLRRQAFAYARAWTAARPARRDASHALTALIRNGEALGDFNDIWPQAVRWLDVNGKSSDASYVLQALMSVDGLEDRQVDATWNYVSTWIEGRPTDAKASFLLKALLAWKLLRPQDVHDAWAAVDTWIAANLDARDADFLLHASLEWDRCDSDIAAKIWPNARRWLLANGATPASTYVLRAALVWAHLPAGEHPVVLQAAAKWLTAAGTHLEATYILQALLQFEPLDRDQSEWVWAAALQWLERYVERRESSFLLEPLIGWQYLTAERFYELGGMIEAWWKAHSLQRAARSILSIQLKLEKGVVAGSSERLLAEAIDWINAHVDDELAGFVWLELFDSPFMGEGERSRLPVTAAARWLSLHPRHRVAGGVLQRVLARNDSSESVQDALWTGMQELVSGLESGAAANFALQAIAGWPPMVRFDAAPVFAAVSRWLSLDLDGSGSYLIAAVFDGPLAEKAAALAPALRGWLDACGTLEPARHALVPLLTRRIPELAAHLERATLGWLDTNVDSVHAPRVALALLDTGEANSRLLQSMWPAVAVALESRSAPQLRSRLLQALVLQPNLDSEQSLTVWDAAAGWLESFGTEAAASFLLQAIVSWRSASRPPTDIAWIYIDRWLAAFATSDRAVFLLEATSNWERFEGSRADEYFEHLHAWLTANPSHRLTFRLMQRVISSPSFSNRQIAFFISQSRAWFRQQAADVNGRKKALSMVWAPSVSSARRSVILPLLRRPQTASRKVRT